MDGHVIDVQQCLYHTVGQTCSVPIRIELSLTDGSSCVVGTAEPMDEFMWSSESVVTVETVLGQCSALGQCLDTVTVR
jgi:hypothetical protein